MRNNLIDGGAMSERTGLPLCYAVENWKLVQLFTHTLTNSCMLVRRKLYETYKIRSFSNNQYVLFKLVKLIN